MAVISRAVSAAVRPWQSLDASGWMYNEGRWTESDLTSYDTQAQINLCMRCSLADECVDCLAQKRRPRKRRRKSVRA